MRNKETAVLLAVYGSVGMCRYNSILCISAAQFQNTKIKFL